MAQVILFTLELGISLYAQGCRTFFCGRERWWTLDGHNPASARAATTVPATAGDRRARACDSGFSEPCGGDGPSTFPGLVQPLTLLAVIGMAFHGFNRFQTRIYHTKKHSSGQLPVCRGMQSSKGSLSTEVGL